jgi:hypothetical protein
MALFPRLPNDEALLAHSTILASPIDVLEKNATLSADTRYFAPTGGNPITLHQLRIFRQGVEGLARSCGYPAGDTREAKAIFDAKCAAWLVTNWPAISGEALRTDTWNYVTVVMLPHIAKWRFPKLKAERISGNIQRNVFGRLWLRGRAFDRGHTHGERWGLLGALLEDTFVAIMERPSLSGNPAIARKIGEVWVHYAETIPAGVLESTHREVMKRLLVLHTCYNLDVLSDSNLERVIVDTYRSTVAAMGIRPILAQVE